MKGILFTWYMIEQIIRGKKTETRREIKGVTEAWSYVAPMHNEAGEKVWELFGMPDGKPYYYKRPFKEGEIIYIKESYCVYKNHIYYKNDGNFNPKKYGLKWVSALFCPQSAARYFLKIAYIWVEQLLDITDDTAKYEGFWTRGEFLVYFWAIKNRTEANPYVWVIDFDYLRTKP